MALAPAQPFLARVDISEIIGGVGIGELRVRSAVICDHVARCDIGCDPPLVLRPLDMTGIDEERRLFDACCLQAGDQHACAVVLSEERARGTGHIVEGQRDALSRLGWRSGYLLDVTASGKQAEEEGKEPAHGPGH